VDPLRRRPGFGDWSLSAQAKVKVRNALQFIETVERAPASATEPAPRPDVAVSAAGGFPDRVRIGSLSG
jgi:hypothetical protein